MAFILSRNAKLFVTTAIAPASESVTAGLETVTGNMNDGNTWQIPVLDGFSFSQGTATQEVQISEAGSVPARGQRVYNTALEPVNWSFSNYMRPRYDSSTPLGGDAVERLLWEAHAAPGPSGTGSDQNPIATEVDGLATTRGTSPDDMAVSYSQSNTNQLLPLSLFFKMDEIWYWIRDAVVDTAEIDFSIESIATITWSGFGNEIRRVDPTDDSTALAELNTVASNGRDYAALAGTAGYLAAPSDTACIRNKLTSLTLAEYQSPYTAYTLPITGGSITISNNITYLTPESLGVLNKPCAHFTGARTVTGNLTAYLRTGSNESADLMGKLQSAITAGTDPENFDLDIYLGGSASDTGVNPTIQLSLPHAHLVVPVINLEDVISVDIGFNGLPYSEVTGEDTWDLEETNEVTVTYHAVA